MLGKNDQLAAFKVASSVFYVELQCLVPGLTFQHRVLRNGDPFVFAAPLVAVGDYRSTILCSIGPEKSSDSLKMF
jgi:hypothetical protein